MDNSFKILQNLFSSQNMEQLRHTRNLLNADTVKNNARKADLVSALAQWVTDKPQETLECFPLYELKILSILAQRGEGAILTIPITDACFLSDETGLSEINFHEEKENGAAYLTINFIPGIFSLIAPNIDPVIRKIEQSPRHQYENFFWGCLALYGAVSVKEFFKLLATHYKGEDHETFLFMLDYAALPYTLHHSDKRIDYIVHPSADLESVLAKRHEKRMDNRSLMKHSKEDILDAGSTMPYSRVWGLHNEYKEFSSVLQNLGYKGKDLDTILNSIWLSMQYNGSAGSINTMLRLLAEGKHMTRGALTSLIDAFQHYVNVLPLWEFKGRSPSDMSKNDKHHDEKVATALTLSDRIAKMSSHADTYQKVGRNDPCPCGSGLKYKNCHGKNIS